MIQAVSVGLLVHTGDLMDTSRTLACQQLHKQTFCYEGARVAI